MKKNFAVVGKKCAFTLAEVLITLGIIGVVAAMTLPTLVAKYKKQQTVVQLKKAYTELHKVVEMSEVENGDCKDWDYNLDAVNFYNKYLKKYLKKTAELSAGDYKASDIKMLNGSDCNGSWCGDNASQYIKLADGTVLGISSYKGGNYKAVLVDLNGKGKPNVHGKDVFVFTIQGKIRVAPYGIRNSEGIAIGDSYDRDIITGSNMRACTKAGNGVWCAALIMADGWEIKDDYPF